jgi:hypothetical protein
MSPEMQRIVEDYLARLRRAMRGVTPDVVDEVTREIRAHIDDALSARRANSVSDLLDALDRLGPPEEYARDLGLYMMVDRGYREWSLPHMVRSTAFWALSTVVGAVVVLIFGLLYALAGGLVLAGGQRIVAPHLVLPLPPVLPGLAGGLLVAAGVVGIAVVTLMVRWFIGQYVLSARPHALGGAEADSDWAVRTSRRIIMLALAGLVITLLAGVAGGVDRLSPPYALRWPDDYFGSVAGFASFAGLTLLLLSPALGLAWTVMRERGGTSGRGGGRP